MPIYEYVCADCGDRFEVMQRIKDKPLTDHDGCGGSVERVISQSSFALKGSGWYKDHYGLKSSGGSGDGSSSSSSSSNKSAA